MHNQWAKSEIPVLEFSARGGCLSDYPKVVVNAD
jgi:hypothetical protein